MSFRHCNLQIFFYKLQIISSGMQKERKKEKAYLLDLLFSAIYCGVENLSISATIYFFKMIYFCHVTAIFESPRETRYFSISPPSSSVSHENIDERTFIFRTMKCRVAI